MPPKLGESPKQLNEAISLNPSNRGVQLRLDRCSPKTLVQDGCLAKVVATLESLAELETLVDCLLLLVHALVLVELATGHLELAIHDDMEVLLWQELLLFEVVDFVVLGNDDLLRSDEVQL